jgi:hypothetical protein
MNPSPAAAQDPPHHHHRACLPTRANAVMRSHDRSWHGRRNELITQRLTLVLAGITASDYLTWVHDPEPPALGRDLRSTRVHAEALDNRVHVRLTWNSNPPSARAAATAAGFTLIPEIIDIRTSHF